MLRGWKLLHEATRLLTVWLSLLICHQQGAWPALYKFIAASALGCCACNHSLPLTGQRLWLLSCNFMARICQCKHGSGGPKDSSGWGLPPLAAHLQSPPGRGRLGAGDPCGAGQPSRPASPHLRHPPRIRRSQGPAPPPASAAMSGLCFQLTARAANLQQEG